MKYKDFNITIDRKHDDEFDVSITSPAGEGSSKLRLPFSTDEAIEMLQSLGQVVRGLEGEDVDEVRGARARAQASPPVDVGRILFDNLFVGTTRSLLDQSLGMISAEEDTGLRIKLHIDPRDPDVAELASLPWELLYKEDTKEYLNLSRQTPLVRYLQVQRSSDKITFVPPLRILVVTTSPEGVAALDLEKEQQLIKDNWANLPDVEVEFLEHATIKRLNNELAEKPYHVLHFMGHGDFDPEAGKGVLVFENDEGKPAFVDGTTMGVVLRDIKTLQLVVLNACNTAKASDQRGKDPFAGVATAMIMAEVPAVVAMQFPITDKAAVEFAGTFYPRLAKGMPIDSAVSEGRKAIRLLDSKSMEWATPVLFMRSKDGILFDIPVDETGPIVVPPLQEKIIHEVPDVEPQAKSDEPKGDRQDPTRGGTKNEPRPAFAWKKVAMFGVPVLVLAGVVFWLVSAFGSLSISGSPDIYRNVETALNFSGKASAGLSLVSTKPDVVSVNYKYSDDGKSFEATVRGGKTGDARIRLMKGDEELDIKQLIVRIHPDSIKAAKQRYEETTERTKVWQNSEVSNQTILTDLRNLSAAFAADVLSEAAILSKLKADTSALSESMEAYQMATQTADSTIQSQQLAWEKAKTALAAARPSPELTEAEAKVTELDQILETVGSVPLFAVCEEYRSGAHCSDQRSLNSGTLYWSMQTTKPGSFTVEVSGPSASRLEPGPFSVNQNRFMGVLGRFNDGEYVVRLLNGNHLVGVKTITVN